MLPSTTVDPGPPVPVITIWSIGAADGSDAASGYQVRLLSATLTVATWAPLANAVTVPCPARLTATSATGVSSMIVHTAGSGGGSRNGHTRGLT